MEQEGGDMWKNRALAWEGRAGPDARIGRVSYTVYSRDAHTDLHDPFSDGKIKDAYCESFKTLDAAKRSYEKRIKRPHTKECDLQMHMEFGGFFWSMGDFYVPRISETYIWLARWREDGAFIETYHINESKFAERDTDRVTDELTRTSKTPGLRSYYEEQHQQKKAKTN